MVTSGTSPYDQLNRWFVRLTFAAPAALGSIGSALIFGGGLWAIGAVISRKVPMRRDRVMMALAVPICAFGAAYLMAFFVNGGGPRQAYYLIQLGPLLLFPFIYSSLAVSDKELIAAASIAGSAVACYAAFLFACFEVVFTTGRAEGMGGNPIIFAQVTCMATLLALAGTFFVNRGYVPLLVAAYFAGIIALVPSGSRTSWVAIAVGTVVVLISNRRALAGTFSRRGVLISGAVALAIGAASVGIVAERVQALRDDWSKVGQPNHESSLGIRIGLWRFGSEIVRDNPLFGIGPQNSRARMEVDLPKSVGIEFASTHYHNGLLTASVEAGLLGGLALCAIFVAALVIALRGSHRPTAQEIFGRSMLVATVTVYVIGGMTGILFGHDLLDAVLMLHLATGAYLAEGSDPVRDASG